MAADAARRLAERDLVARVLPTVSYTAAPFASGFAGTVSVRPETTTALIVDIARSLAGQGVDWLALANAHLDPANLGALYAAVRKLEDGPSPRIVFPDITRRPWAGRLTKEFRSGACHAGRYEGSIVLAERPDLVDEAARLALEAHPVSLSEGIAAGATRFEELGGHEAYFGDPAAATAAEGKATVAVLGEILAEAVLEAIGEVRRP